MALPESARIRTKLDAITWRLQEASADLERMRKDEADARQRLQDARVAALLGEEAPGDVSVIARKTEAVQGAVIEETSLVERLAQRRIETDERYQRALRREWTRVLLERWKQQSESPESELLD